MREKNRKFNVGDIVSLEGQKEQFEITEWFYECSFDNIDGMYERSSYTMRGKKSGKYLDFIYEDDEDLKLVKSGSSEEVVEKFDQEEEILEEVFSLELYKKPLHKEEVDFLLDKYNDFMNVHLLLKHIGIVENEYKDMATQIVEYLSKK